MERGNIPTEIDETRQFLILAIGLLAVGVFAVVFSIKTGLYLGNYPLELSGYCLCVLSFVIIGAIERGEPKRESNES